MGRQKQVGVNAGDEDPDVRQDQDRVAVALQQCNPHSMPEGSLLTGWVVVAEFMDPNGEKWLTRLSHPGSSVWTTDGLLHYGLHKMGTEPE